MGGKREGKGGSFGGNVGDNGLQNKVVRLMCPSQISDVLKSGVLIGLQATFHHFNIMQRTTEAQQ
jgi:hypothetical protein